MYHYLYFMAMEAREFPGGPVARTPGSHCWGPGSIPGGGNENPTSCSAQPIKQRRGKRKTRKWRPIKKQKTRTSHPGPMTLSAVLFGEPGNHGHLISSTRILRNTQLSSMRAERCHREGNCLQPSSSHWKYSLEGPMLKVELQYFDHLLRRTDSFEKTLMLGKIEGRRRKG